MAAWLRLHWSQCFVLVFSCALGAALHYGKVTSDQAVEAGALLAAVGIHLPGIVYKMGPPRASTVLMVLVTSGVTVCALSVLDACTPAEQQVGAQDGAKMAGDFARCVAQHAGDQGATPESVSVLCVGVLVPDTIGLIADEIAASRLKAPVDAGAQ